MAGRIVAISADKDLDPKKVLADLYHLTAYQEHGGPQYAGFAVTKPNDPKGMLIRTHRGLVRNTFADDLEGLECHHGIGHTSLQTRQPLALTTRLGNAAFCFSGRVINSEKLINDFLASGHSIGIDQADIEIIARLVGQGNDWVSGLERLESRVKGSFSLAILTPDGVVVTRDPRAYKPLVIGEKKGAIMIASESVGFRKTGFALIRDVRPGEIILLKNGTLQTIGQLPAAEHSQFCAFEWIYSANPASVIQGLEVAEARKRCGCLLAELAPVPNADIVAPVPASGISGAIGFAERSGIPFGEAFIRYESSFRSYSQATQEARSYEAWFKLVPIEGNIRGKIIVLVDDSIVRSTQIEELIKLLLDLGAKEVHVRVTCPPLTAACPYDVSTRKKGELAIAKYGDVKKIRQAIGATTLFYLPMDKMVEALGFAAEDLCLHCWS